MGYALPLDPDRKEQLSSHILNLAVACPHDNCNPPFCPLHDVRKLTSGARAEWVGILTNDDLEYLTVHHEICLQSRTEQDPATISKLSMDALAKRIRLGILNSGFYILSQEELKTALGHYFNMSNEEMRLHVKNFAHQYGFTAISEHGCTDIAFKSLKRSSEQPA